MNNITFNKNVPHQDKLRIAFNNCVMIVMMRLKHNPKLNVNVNWNKRLKTTGGYAKLKKNEIDLNANLFSQSENEEHLVNTFIHELAHLIDYSIRGKSNHDKFWKQLFVDLGGNGQRCHKMNTEKFSTRKHKYMCNCQTYMLSTTRHNKQQKGKANYCCRKCKATLRYQIIG